MRNRPGWIVLVTVPLWACAGEPDAGSDLTADVTVTPPVEDLTQPLTGAADPVHIDLTLDMVQRFAEAHRTLRAGGVRTADLAPPLEESAVPREVRRAIRATGLTVDEFLVVNASLLPAYFVARLREAGLPATERPAGVHEAHVSFVERHRDEIERLLDLEMD